MSKQGKTKLTLSCNPTIIEEAKKYVNLEEESLSSVVEEFLSTYIAIKKNKLAGKYAFHALEVEKLSGAFKLGSHRNYKKEFKA
ncbi:MAG: hypothetical protein CFE21_12630 [Bacteroidetes bacterium B1(2017)]|nr:MAG: hypothetical protein CFE21_12630 [Bacteroidetes bacterium B1(2017)]